MWLGQALGSCFEGSTHCFHSAEPAAVPGCGATAPAVVPTTLLGVSVSPQPDSESGRSKENAAFHALTPHWPKQGRSGFLGSSMCSSSWALVQWWVPAGDRHSR